MQNGCTRTYQFIVVAGLRKSLGCIGRGVHGKAFSSGNLQAVIIARKNNLPATPVTAVLLWKDIVFVHAFNRSFVSSKGGCVPLVYIALIRTVPGISALGQCLRQREYDAESGQCRKDVRLMSFQFQSQRARTINCPIGRKLHKRHAISGNKIRFRVNPDSSICQNLCFKCSALYHRTMITRILPLCADISVIVCRRTPDRIL